MNSATEARRAANQAPPLFSICIPQYNRTSFLMEACRSLGAQTFRDFEICISDDCSTDGREQELVSLLSELGVEYVYRRNERNLRYDGNLRSAIQLSHGIYCFLLGNDDCLTDPDVLLRLAGLLQRTGEVGVAITNYTDFTTGVVTKRFGATGIAGQGPSAAVNTYRNFSFISGVILHGPSARALETDRWDGSEMYQTYLGCRILAAGGRLLGVEDAAIRKDIRLPGESVDSYARRPRLDPCPIVERRLNLDAINRLVADALAPYVIPRQRGSYVLRVALQTVLFTYPFWLFEYRRVQSWRYALGVCLGMRPRYLLRDLQLNPARAAAVVLAYLAASASGLLLPIRLFSVAYRPLHLLAKRTRFIRLSLRQSSLP